MTTYDHDSGMWWRLPAALLFIALGTAGGFFGGRYSTVREYAPKLASIENERDHARTDLARRKGYSGDIVQTFMSACIWSGGTDGVCACTLERIENRYTIQEFSQIEVKLSATGQLPDEILNDLGSCRVLAR